MREAWQGLTVLAIALALSACLFWAGRLYERSRAEGRQTVIALARVIFGREPTGQELAYGLDLWRRSPEALIKATRPHLAPRPGGPAPADRPARQEGDYDLSFVDQNGRRISDRAGRLTLVLDPFTIYAHWPNQRTARFRIDADGFRATPDRPGQPRIAVVGGSAAFGHMSPSDETTFAWKLGERLSDYQVVNAGVVGYLSGQELALMLHRLDRLQPHAYVVFDGWNDLVDQYLWWRRPRHLLGFNNQFFVIQKRLHDAQTGAWSSPDEIALAKAEAGDEPYLETIYDNYLANIGRMHAFATARGAAFLVALQPEAGNQPFPTAHEKRVTASFDQQTAGRYRGLNFPIRYAGLVRRARERFRAVGIPYTDVQREPEFAGERQTVFHDFVHLNERGHTLVAKVLERHLRRVLAAPRAGAGPRPPVAAAGTR